jgi:23S rRNA-/tRNA-specific pseudouridylate synthase
VLIALNKPYGVVSKFSPEAGKRTLADYVPIRNVYPAGRLDTDSEGLLLLTDDGALQARIANPRHKLPKTYWAQVEGLPTDAALAARAAASTRRLRDEARGCAPHRRARESLASRSTDPLPRSHTHGLGRDHAARGQEPPGASHDGASRFSHSAPGAGGRR